MNIAILGGAGFIGSNLADEFIKNGNSVIVIDNLCSSKEGDVNPEAIFKNLDVLNSRKLSGFIKGAEVVINCVGTTSSEKDDYRNLTVNNKTALSIADAISSSGVKTIINFSDAHVYGKRVHAQTPLEESFVPKDSSSSIYGISKLSSELIFNNLIGDGIKVIHIRPGLVCGKRQKYGNVLSIFIKYSIDGKIFSVFGEGKSERDFVHIEDLVRMVGLLLDKINYLHSTSYNCGGSSVSISNLATMVATKYSGDFVREDVSLGEKSEYTGIRRFPEYIDCMKLSLRKADLELGYMPVKKITDIIADTAWYYVNNKSRWLTYEID